MNPPIMMFLGGARKLENIYSPVTQAQDETPAPAAVRRKHYHSSALELKQLMQSHYWVDIQ